VIDILELDMGEWEKTYSPITNHLDENASFNNGNGGIMFETYGDEVEFVKSQNPNNIWTWVDGDSGRSYILSGYRFVNRIGYFITEKPWETDVDVLVQDANYLCPNCDTEWEGDAAELMYETLSEIDKCTACATLEEIKETQ